MLLVFGVGGHAHEAANAHIGILFLRIIVKYSSEFIGIKTEFGFFFGNVYLQEAMNYAVVLRGFLVQFLQHFYTVYTMHQVYKRRHVFYFVGLHMAYKMPADILWQVFRLGRQILYFVFAKITVPCFISFHNSSFRFCFADSYQRYMLGYFSF